MKMRILEILRPLILIIICSSSASAEVYDPQSEKHDDVTICTGEEPIEVVYSIYLSRASFNEEATIEELVNDLLRFDIEGREAALDFELPEKETTEYDGLAKIRVKQYLAAGAASLMARCAVDNYRPGDRIYRFSNTEIYPSTQEGYVFVRNGKVVLQIVTWAKYVD